MRRIHERIEREWDALDDDDPAPIKKIARNLGMSTRDVALYVYPSEELGPWCDCCEPPLVDDWVRARALGED